jgi:hypothetical protein
MYGPSAGPAETICVVLEYGGMGSVLPNDLLRWFNAVGRATGYALLRVTTPGVESTPNGGTRRTPDEIGAWCDAHTSALVRHSVLLKRPGAPREHRRPPPVVHVS